MTTSPIENVLILGAGWVGRQIAVRLAAASVDVWLMDRDEESCEAAIQWMRSTERDESWAGIPDAQEWIHRVHIAPPLTRLRDEPTLLHSARIQLVIENVPEQLSLKRRVLKLASQVFPAPIMITSNSSYFLPSILAEHVEAPERFAHFHFHVPVLRNTVADIVGNKSTEPQVLEQLRVLSLRIGQHPMLLRHEHPGYLFNWMLQALLRSAMELAALDVADPEDIDKSWKAVSGMPIGPFGMMDQIGLDVTEQVLANGRWADPPQVDVQQMQRLLQALTDQGKLGKKTGQGFYDYREPNPE